MRSLKRSRRGKMLLVGTKVSRNHNVQKETIASDLGKHNVAAEMIPSISKIAVARIAVLGKKVLGKS